MVAGINLFASGLLIYPEPVLPMVKAVLLEGRLFSSDPPSILGRYLCAMRYKYIKVIVSSVA